MAICGRLRCELRENRIYEKIVLVQEVVLCLQFHGLNERGQVDLKGFCRDVSGCVVCLFQI